MDKLQTNQLFQLGVMHVEKNKYNQLTNAKQLKNTGNNFSDQKDTKCQISCGL